MVVFYSANHLGLERVKEAFKDEARPIRYVATDGFGGAKIDVCIRANEKVWFAYPVCGEIGRCSLAELTGVFGF